MERHGLKTGALITRLCFSQIFSASNRTKGQKSLMSGLFSLLQEQEDLQKYTLTTLAVLQLNKDPVSQPCVKTHRILPATPPFQCLNLLFIQLFIASILRKKCSIIGDRKVKTITTYPLQGLSPGEAPGERDPWLVHKPFSFVELK